MILPAKLDNFKVHFVGIKGTGMSALAELFSDRGADISGSDTGERFYTDGILRSLKIPFAELFDADNIAADTQLVIHSPAYSKQTNPELLRAEELGLPIMTYPEALGAVSGTVDSSGITGTHGKSTVTAISGTLLKYLNLPATALAGTAVPTFGDRSTISRGDKYFIAETCEYRRHFLHFHPKRIVLTNVELDHTDYFTSLDDMKDAFMQYASSLPKDGELIYCADDAGATDVANELRRRDNPPLCTPYGFTAQGDFGVHSVTESDGEISFRLRGFETEMAIRVPGLHNVLNAVASLTLIHSLVRRERGTFTTEDEKQCARGLAAFRGSRRRSQVIGTINGITFIDDYGHHPTALRKTIEGYRKFYPGRRLIVDFMSHTYTRTDDLFKGFVTAFDEPDVVVLHKIYASAREGVGEVTGEDLHRAVCRRRENVHYFHEVMDAFDFASDLLKTGDLFVTMGAGDNWRLGEALYAGLGNG